MTKTAYSRLQRKKEINGIPERKIDYKGWRKAEYSSRSYYDNSDFGMSLALPMAMRHRWRLK